MKESWASMTSELGAPGLEFNSAPSAVSRGGSATRDFTDRVCTGHSPLMRAWYAIYRLDNVLDGAHMQGEYLSRFRMKVSEGSHLLHIGDSDRDEECGCRTLSHGADGDKVDVCTSPRSLRS